jgi:hypothetical protein
MQVVCLGDCKNKIIHLRKYQNIFHFVDTVHQAKYIIFSFYVRDTTNINHIIQKYCTCKNIVGFTHLLITILVFSDDDFIIRKDSFLEWDCYFCNYAVIWAVI